MAVDTTAIGAQTGAWHITLERSVLANFARAVRDERPEYRSAGAPAPPTFTFAAPYWSAYFPEAQPPDPTRGGANPMHTIMGDLFAKGALVLHGEQEFEYHRMPRAGDVLDGDQRITDIYEKETDTAHMTFVVMETRWRDASGGEPVVTERFNLIARIRKQG